MSYAGFDTAQFPGLPAMAWLKQHTNLTWVNFYLYPAPAQRVNYKWMPQRAALEQQGWGLVPTYLGRQITGPGRHMSAASIAAAGEGRIDGTAAVALMHSAGFGDGHYVMLDCENGPPMPMNQQAYVKAWCGAVENTAYKPGVYCSYKNAGTVARSVPHARIWAFRIVKSTRHAVASPFPTPDPAGAHPAAYLWQREFNAVISVPGKKIVADLDSAKSASPARP